LIKDTADEAKVERPAEVDAGAANFDEYVQPPIERRTLRFRFCFLRR
jgi:hypothetical protein